MIEILTGSRDMTFVSLLAAGTGILLFMAFRSALLVGAAFLWLRFSAFAKRRRIVRGAFADGQIASELKAAIPVLVFDAAAAAAVIGAGWIRIGEPSWQLAALTFAGMFVWFEIWFYATHRLMHTRSLYWIHRQHHTAHVVDPLASLSFSILERAILLLGALGAAVAFSRLVHPIGAAGLFAYALTNYALNVLGHTNVEVYPAWFARSPVGRWIVTPTYHALHHARYRGHYGLFTSVLDRAFGDVFPDYELVQERASAGNGLSRPGERVNSGTKDMAVAGGSR
jgi:sterol desaturase/sphingolipid hydroxylase (fatty acid hydroxylase superfamily)